MTLEHRHYVFFCVYFRFAFAVMMMKACGGLEVLDRLVYR